jgi:Grx4 family monothiol glutaredoxin
MNEVVRELAKKYDNLLVLQVEADVQSDVAESFEIEAVPSFLILRGHTLLSRINGADAPGLINSVAVHAQRPSVNPLSKTTASPAPRTYSDSSMPEQGEAEELNVRLNRLMNQSKVVLFMKGEPDAPRCGFSRRTVALLREKKVEFSHFDILSDESVRQGLKVLNDWPTFPQLIINGEFVGGLDVVTEMDANGELAELLA